MQRQTAVNPFQFGRELSSGELVDRKLEVEAVVEAMEEGGKLFLVGPRRHGKTSILKAAADRVAARKGVVLRYDAEAFTSIELLAGRILSDTASSLTSTIDKAASTIGEFFKSVRPVATYNAVEHKWSVSLAGTPGRAAGAPLLADVLDGVEATAKKTKRSVAVVIDEFQKVIVEGGADAEAQIRAAIQRHRKVGYVFAGSNTRLIGDMTANPRRPFYKLGQVRFVGPLPRKDFAEFLERGFEAGGIRVAFGAIDAILDLAEEVPYTVQLVAHECWHLARSLKVATLTAELVKDARDMGALRNDPIYSQMWVLLTAIQQRALLALLRERSGLTSREVTKRYEISAPAMQKSLAALETKGLVRQEAVKGETRLRLEDPLFGAWIELVVPR